MSELIINLVIVFIVLAILGGCVFYIIREKKKGARCIGCPYAKSCGKNGKCSPH